MTVLATWLVDSAEEHSTNVPSRSSRVLLLSTEVRPRGLTQSLWRLKGCKEDLSALCRAFFHIRVRKRNGQWFKVLSLADDFHPGHTRPAEYGCKPKSKRNCSSTRSSVTRELSRRILQVSECVREPSISPAHPECGTTVHKYSKLDRSSRWWNLILGCERKLRREVAVLSAACHVENHTRSVYIPGWWFILYMTSSPVTIIHTFYYSLGMFILRRSKVNVLSVHLQIWCSCSSSPDIHHNQTVSWPWETSPAPSPSLWLWHGLFWPF